MTKPQMPRVMKRNTEVDEPPLSPRKKKTLTERIRAIRRIINETDEAIDRLHASTVEARPRSMLGGPGGPDQLTLLRGALARIVMALGPAIDSKKSEKGEEEE
jgi:hypothetical protein